jgi:type III pantothenate kinase
MFLAADIGNTNIVLGFKQGDTWSHILRIETSDPTEKYALIISDFVLERNIDSSLIESVALSSVVPWLTDPVIKILENLTQQRVYSLGPEFYHTLPVKIRNPEEMGTDLIANSLAAYNSARSKCLVVDFGTALTFTSVGDDGEILGVAIAPGLKTAMKSLSKSTAKLPEIPLVIPESALGKNTIHAMQAGILLGYTGLVEKMIAKIKSEIGEPVRVYATGGLSSILSNLNYLFDEVNANLTLEGLHEFHKLVSRK